MLFNKHPSIYMVGFSYIIYNNIYLLMDKETINEHIRNGLSPLQCLIGLLKSYRDNEDQRETIMAYILSRLDNFQKSIDRLCVLGQNAYEDDEDLWRMSYYINQTA